MKINFPRHIAYAQYVFRHKKAVYRAGVELMKMISSPTAKIIFWIRLVTHDWSKFSPDEWLPYARSFYAPDGAKQYQPDHAFDRAWMLHQHRQPHHWQWHLSTRTSFGETPLSKTNVLVYDKGNVAIVLYSVTEALSPNRIDGKPWISVRQPMPHLDILEMLADWWGAGYAINGTSSWQSVFDWYMKQDGMLLHSDTTRLIDETLAELRHAETIDSN